MDAPIGEGNGSTPPPDKSSEPLVLKHAVEFECAEPGEDRVCVATNGHVSVTVLPGEDPQETMIKWPSGAKAHVSKRNLLKQVGTPDAYKEQWCLAELNGIWVHIKDDNGQVHIIVTDKRMC